MPLTLEPDAASRGASRRARAAAPRPSSTAPQSSPRRTYAGQRAGGRRLVGDRALDVCPTYACQPVERGGAVPRGRTRTSRRTASAAGPGAGPSPGSSRARASGGPGGGGCAHARRDVVGVADREHVGRAVGQPDAGAGRGRLHDQLGVVGDRVLERLVRRRRSRRTPSSRRCRSAARSAARRPRAPSAPPAPCRPGRGSTAASRPGPRTGGPAPRTTCTIASTWSTLVTLGSVTTQPSRLPPLLAHGRDVRRQRPDRPAPGRRLEALDPDAAERRRRARLLALRQRRPRPRTTSASSSASLFPTYPSSKSTRRSSTGSAASLARTRATRSSSPTSAANASACSSITCQRRRAVRRHQVGGVPVRRHVHRVHRLPPRPLPRVARSPAPRPPPPAARPARPSVGRRARRGRPCGPSNYTPPSDPALHKARARRLGSRSGQTTHRGMVRPSRNGETSEEGASRRAWRDVGRRPGPHHGPTGSRNPPVRRGHTRRARIGVRKASPAREPSPATSCPTRRRRSAARCARKPSRPSSTARRRPSSAVRARSSSSAVTMRRAARPQGCEVRRARAREDRQDLRDPGRVRQRAAPELPGPGHRPGHAGPDHASTARCTTQIPEPDRAVDNSTVWQAGLQPRRTTRTCTSATATASSRSRPTTRSSRPAATASTARSPTG